MTGPVPFADFVRREFAKKTFFTKIYSFIFSTITAGALGFLFYHAEKNVALFYQIGSGVVLLVGIVLLLVGLSKMSIPCLRIAQWVVTAGYIAFSWPFLVLTAIVIYRHLWTHLGIAACLMLGGITLYTTISAIFFVLAARQFTRELRTLAVNPPLDVYQAQA